MRNSTYITKAEVGLPVIGELLMVMTAGDDFAAGICVEVPALLITTTAVPAELSEIVVPDCTIALPGTRVCVPITYADAEFCVIIELPMAITAGGEEDEAAGSRTCVAVVEPAITTTAVPMEFSEMVVPDWVI